MGLKKRYSKTVYMDDGMFVINDCTYRMWEESYSERVYGRYLDFNRYAV